MQNSAVRLKAIKTGGNSLNPPASMTLNLLSGAISSLVTFTRATTATVTDWEGLIKNTKSGEARFDGMRRVENLLTYSQDFSNWGKNNTLVVSDVINAPDGTLTADAITGSSSVSNQKYVLATKTGATNGTYVFTVYLKAGTQSAVVVRINDNTALNGARVAVNLFTGAITSTVTDGTCLSTISAINDAGNGWYRILIGTTYTTSLTQVQANIWFDGYGPSTSTNTFYIWGAQLENVTGQTNQNPSEYVSTNAIRRNLLTYSEQFDNAVWTKSNATVTTNAVVAPDGTLTADSQIPSTLSATHTTYVNATLINGVQYTLSIYAKPNGYNRILLRESTTLGLFASFDVSTGVALATSGVITATCVAAGNGFYRCSMTFIAPASISTALSYFNLTNTGSTYVDAVFAGDGTSGIYIWGAQLEVSPAATTYQKVTDAGPQDFNNYQGANVDGVQYFPYTNPNCIINGAITQIPTIAINSDNSKFAYNCVASGDYFSTPNATANQITGDISLLVQVALDDWTPATVQTLVAKDGVTSQRSWAFNVQSSGALRLNYSLDGSTITSVTSTASTGFTDGTVHFVGVQREAATGIVRFYTSEDGTTFTQLGTDQTGTAGSLFNSNTSVQFGNLSSLAFELNGKIYDSHVYTGLKFSGNTLGSELVVNGDFSQGTTGWTLGGAGLPTFTVTSGQATITNTATGSLVINNVTLTAGILYKIELDVISSNNVNFVARTSGGGLDATPLSLATTGHKIFYAIPTVSGVFSVGNVTPISAGALLTVDNISVVQVTPNTATASSTMVMDFDPSNWTSGTSFTGLETGEVWTLNGNAKIYQGLWDAVGPKSWLIEEQRVNLCLYSQDWTNAAWLKTNITLGASGIAPDGTLTAARIQATASVATLLKQHINAAATTQTYSIYAKQGSGVIDANSFAVYNNTTATNLAVLSINYGTGVVTQTIGTGATATAAGNGFWRIVIPVTSGITVADSLAIYPCFTGNAETAGEYAYVWGAQLE